MVVQIGVDPAARETGEERTDGGVEKPLERDRVRWVERAEGGGAH